MTITGDADYVYRYCTRSDSNYDCFVFEVDDSSTSAGTADVALESLGMGALREHSGQNTFGVFNRSAASVSLDRVDIDGVDSGLFGLDSDTEFNVSGCLFWDNWVGVGGSYWWWGAHQGYETIEDSFFYQNIIGARYPNRVTGSDFVENGTGVRLTTGISYDWKTELVQTVATSTFVDNELGVRVIWGGGMVLTSSFSGNIQHWDGGGHVVQVTFGPNDPDTCEAPVITEGLALRSVNSIFAAPDCGTAPACSGELVALSGSSLVENIGDLVYPDCTLGGTGTWLYGVDGFTLDPGLDALEYHRTFTSDLYGSIDVGGAHPLLSTSPAIDAGGRALRRPDLAGNLYIQDGNGDGTRARDLGALEYVP